MGSTVTLTKDYGQEAYKASGLADSTVIDAKAASWIIDNSVLDGDGANAYPFRVYSSPNVTIEGGVMHGEVSLTEKHRDVRQMRADRVAAGRVCRILYANVDRAAVFIPIEMVRRLALIEAHDGRELLLGFARDLLIAPARIQRCAHPPSVIAPPPAVKRKASAAI